MVDDRSILHVPHVLFHRFAENVRDEPAESASDAARAVTEHLERMGLDRALRATAAPSGVVNVRIREQENEPRTSIIIPTRDLYSYLNRCTSSLLGKTQYSQYEVVIVDNDTREPEAVALLNELAQRPNVKIIPNPGQFNFSHAVNIGVEASSGEVCVLLNNDTEVIDGGWLAELVGHAMREDVGAVGARLDYGDGTIQHAGVALGIGGVAAHVHRGAPHAYEGPNHELMHVRRQACVTAACLATRKSIYQDLGGFNEVDLPVALNDVDYCLRVNRAGYHVIWTPHAQLKHHESVSRGKKNLDQEQRQRASRERRYMRKTWGALLRNDPYYNPNQSLNSTFGEAAFPPRTRVPGGITGQHHARTPSEVLSHGRKRTNVANARTNDDRPSTQLTDLRASDSGELRLHIGLPKTGTSMIQTFLATNTEQLARIGWAYPEFDPLDRARAARVDSGNAVRLAMSLHDDFGNDAFNGSPRSEELIEDLFAEHARSEQPRILLSSEQFAVNPTPSLARIVEAADSRGIRTTVLCYIREQSQALQSFYA